MCAVSINATRKDEAQPHLLFGSTAVRVRFGSGASGSLLGQPVRLGLGPLAPCGLFARRGKDSECTQRSTLR